MDHIDLIDSQISLLAQLNQQLADQGTLETVREIRANTLAIVELMKTKDQEDMESLEFRVAQLEECILGSKGKIGLGERVIYLMDTVGTLDNYEDRIWEVELRIGGDYWDVPDEDEDLPAYPHGETLLGLIERVEKLEAGE